MSVAERQIDEWSRNDSLFGLTIEDDPETTILPTIPRSRCSRIVIRNCPNLVHIPHLSDSLQSLLIFNCPKLQTLPTNMPSDLYYVDMEVTDISKLPIFSCALEHLVIRRAPSLKYISYLPSSLHYVLIQESQLETLPNILPINLFTLRIKDSHLRELPPLPDSLNTLEVSSSYLTHMNGDFPKTLQSITITSSPITELPSLPQILIELNISDTQISRLPSLPSTLASLYIDSTPISELHEMPPNINTLSCSFTKVRILPRLPMKMDVLNLSYTPNNYLRAAEFVNTYIYAMKTHAYTIDEFPDTIKHIHFTHPEFNVLDLPPLRNTIVSFVYDGTFVTIRPFEHLGDFEILLLQERKHQAARIASRLQCYKEELIMKTWHPSRILDWCGVDFEADD